MATTTIIPDGLWQFPCVITGIGTFRYPRQEEDTPESDDPRDGEDYDPRSPDGPNSLPTREAPDAPGEEGGSSTGGESPSGSAPAIGNEANPTAGFTIIKICQRPLDTDIVDIWFRVGYEGTWVLDIDDCGYQDSVGNWYQLKPYIGDANQDGTLVSGNAGGTKVTYTYEAKAARPNVFQLVWDASDYAGFLADPQVSIKFVLAPYYAHDYYAFTGVVAIGDNGQGVQTSITKPAKDDDSEKELFAYFNKGFTEPSCIICVVDNGLQIVYTLESSGICDCYTVCGAETILGLCPDGKIYTLDIPASSVPSSDPFRQSVTFQDSLGNTTTVVARALENVTPPAPTVTLVAGTQMTIDINYTLGAFDLSDDAEWYRIERYFGDDSNRSLVSDWTEVTGTDQDIDTTTLVAGYPYGYRVRLKTRNGSLSKWSNWTTTVFTS